VKKIRLCTTLLSFVALVLLANRVNGDIIVVAPTATTDGSFQITSDITFTVTANGTANVFVLDEWVNSDSSWNFANYSPDLLISVNGGASGSYAGRFSDNFTFSAAQLSANDGYLVPNVGILVAPGDTVTLKAGTYALGAVEGFNPQATQTFSGNMFITNAVGEQLSNTVAVPEPSTLCLVIAAGLKMLAIRRKRPR
jgi:hypothetical protein